MGYARQQKREEHGGNDGAGHKDGDIFCAVHRTARGREKVFCTRCARASVGGLGRGAAVNVLEWRLLRAMKRGTVSESIVMSVAVYDATVACVKIRENVRVSLKFTALHWIKWNAIQFCIMIQRIGFGIRKKDMNEVLTLVFTEKHRSYCPPQRTRQSDSATLPRIVC